MSDTLEVKKRQSTGSAASRRLRNEGMVPAVLYGHGEANEHLAVQARQVQTALRHHSKTITLSGEVNETALISTIHYDPLGIDVLHLDLIRVNLKEKVEVTVPIHTRGQAVGLQQGGILLENLHEVDIRCSAGSIPDALELDVSKLALGEHLAASDLVLPDGVELLTDGDVVVAHVEEPRAAPEPEDETEASGEPEVVAKAGGEGDEKEDA